MLPLSTFKQIPLLDLKAQHGRIRDEVLAALIEQIDSQEFILGATVRSFETEIAAYCRTPFAIACASGSDALLLALLGAGISPGDRVITTPFTFFATAGAISRVGAVPVFADIDDGTFNLDLQKVEEAAKCTPSARAIIVVHLFGGCADMDALMPLAKERQWLVIEDAAQAIGAEYKDRRAGSMGDYGCFSFFPSKNLGGYGDGGMVTTNSAVGAERLAAMRIHGRTGKYLHEWIGVNSRLDAIQAAVLRTKLRYLDHWTARRQQNADAYSAEIATRSLPVRPPERMPYQTRHVYNQFSILCSQRDALRSYLKERGIGSEVYYPVPLHLQTCFAGLGYRKGDFPVSERVAKEILSLPVHPEVSGGDIELICETIKSFYD